jgi:hypothetical protein
MTSQRFTSVAVVALTAVLSAVFVAVAPVQAQGMVSDSTRLASTDRREEASVALALRATSLTAIAEQPSAVSTEARRANVARAEKPAAAAPPSREDRSSGA